MGTSPCNCSFYASSYWVALSYCVLFCCLLIVSWRPCSFLKGNVGGMGLGKRGDGRAGKSGGREIGLIYERRIYFKKLLLHPLQANRFQVFSSVSYNLHQLILRRTSVRMLTVSSTGWKRRWHRPCTQRVFWWERITDLCQGEDGCLERITQLSHCYCSLNFCYNTPLFKCR